MESKMNKNEKVKLRENLAYAIGGGGINLLSVSVLGALLVYYTYVVGISAGVAATVLGISRIFDGISDIVMGRLVDRTHSKYGKAKPWFLRMMIPMMVSIIACFCVPNNWGTMAQAIYMFVTYNLACTVCGTALGVANGALNGFMTLNPESRGLNGAFAMLMNAFSNMAFAAVYLRMAKYFGGGEQYTQKGWLIMVVIFSVIFIPLILISFFGTKERVTGDDMDAPEEPGQASAGQEVSLLESVKMLIFNKYWIITLMVSFFTYFLMSISANVGVYFADYVLGDVNLQAPLNILNNAGTMLGVVLAMPVMVRTGKRLPIVFGMSLYTLITVVPMVHMSAATASVCMAVRGLGIGIAVAPMGSIVHDALTYGLWKNKVNCTGVGSSAITMSSKIGAALSSVLTGALLEASGFISGGGAQPGSAVFMIKGMSIWIPAIFAVLNILILIPYDLDKKYAQITSNLEHGRYAE